MLPETNNFSMDIHGMMLNVYHIDDTFKVLNNMIY